MTCICYQRRIHSERQTDLQKCLCVVGEPQDPHGHSNYNLPRLEASLRRRTGKYMVIYSNSEVPWWAFGGAQGHSPGLAKAPIILYFLSIWGHTLPPNYSHKPSNPSLPSERGPPPSLEGYRYHGTGQRPRPPGDKKKKSFSPHCSPLCR